MHAQHMGGRYGDELEKGLGRHAEIRIRMLFGNTALVAPEEPDFRPRNRRFIRFLRESRIKLFWSLTTGQRDRKPVLRLKGFGNQGGEVVGDPGRHKVGGFTDHYVNHWRPSLAKRSSAARGP